MLNVALDTEEADVFGALLAGGKGFPLAGGALPNGTSVAANASLDRGAVMRAIIELSERKINGNSLRVGGGYNLLVPVGQKIFIEYSWDSPSHRS